MKPFSGNFKILAPLCDVVIPKSGQKTQVSISCTTNCKNIKVTKNHEHYYYYRKIGYSFFYHCWFIMYKFRSFLTQFCVDDVINGDKFLKILKLAS